MALPVTVWQADEAVRRSAAQDWVAARLAWEHRTLGRVARATARPRAAQPTAGEAASSPGSPTKATRPLLSR